jgi:hypothetical protein
VRRLEGLVDTLKRDGVGAGAKLQRSEAENLRWRDECDNQKRDLKASERKMDLLEAENHSLREQVTSLYIHSFILINHSFSLRGMYRFTVLHVLSGATRTYSLFTSCFVLVYPGLGLAYLGLVEHDDNPRFLLVLTRVWC